MREEKWKDSSSSSSSLARPLSSQTTKVLKELIDLVDDDLALHARALVRFAVVAVGTGNVKLVRDLLPRAVQVVLVGDLVGIDASRDVVFVEDDVVRERLVVDEFNSFALGDRDGRRVETEFTVVATQLDGSGKRRVDHEDSRTNDGSLLCRVEMKIERVGQSLFHEHLISSLFEEKKFPPWERKNIQFWFIQKKSFLSFPVDRVQNCKIFAPNRASQNNTKRIQRDAERVDSFEWYDRGRVLLFFEEI